ncbi:hypothetical protein AB0D49_23685 [Streptomyces sp. NPDC048290]|uniref:hypothetical protein n=1 Tax=Streptomyces sp. NPDC048290 TaxID=3155811 RepID=UPI00343E78CD
MAVAVVCVTTVVHFSNVFDSATLDTATHRNLSKGQRWEDLRSVLPRQEVHVIERSE